MMKVPNVAVFICTCVVTIITGQKIVEAPRNTAANFGESVTLYCKAELGGHIVEWGRYLNFTDSLIWDSQENNITDDRFQIDNDTAAGIYNLRIVSAEQDLGGSYYVKLRNSEVKSDVELVVLSGLGCVPSNTHSTEAGLDMLIQCVTGVHGYKAPFMQAHYLDTVLPSQDIISENQKTTVANLSATPERNGTKYWCDLSFKSDENDTMPPLKTDRCDTGMFIVYYGVSNISIEPEVTDVVIGDQFNCTAVSYPAPKFKWYCQDRTMLRIGNILTIDDDLLGEQLCICQAYTTIFGQERISERNITFVTSSPSTPPDESGPPVAAIVSVVAILAAICAGVCIFFLVKTKRQSELNKEQLKALDQELQER